MMERRNKQESTAWDTLMRIALVLGGMIAGIAMCKLCPPFWHWLNSGWMESPWIPRALLAVGGLCISVALCMEDER